MSYIVHVSWVRVLNSVPPYHPTTWSTLPWDSTARKVVPQGDSIVHGVSHSCDSTRVVRHGGHISRSCIDRLLFHVSILNHVESLCGLDSTTCGVLRIEESRGSCWQVREAEKIQRREQPFRQKSYLQSDGNHGSDTIVGFMASVGSLTLRTTLYSLGLFLMVLTMLCCLG